MHNLLSDDTKFTDDPLHRVLSWKTRVMTVKDVKAGDFVGYGTNYLAAKDEKIAIIPTGYGHGYSRSLSNVGKVLIRRKEAPVVGIVNMNLIMVKVTNIHGIKRHDEVVLIGKQGEREITVASFAELTNYVNYELLSRLPADIPRIIVE